MNKWILTLVFLQLMVSGTAQNTIFGNVVDAETGEPLTGASIFISNSSIGTTSNREGDFELPRIPAGRHDLIVSSIGYETTVYSFNSSVLPLRLRIIMHKKVKELEHVVIEPFVEESWAKWGKQFLSVFLGHTPNTKLCLIKNYKAVRFLFYKNSNRLTAIADEPLVIENRALGYIINFQLEDFEISFKNGSTRYAGYPHFIAMQSKREADHKRWIRRRDKAYYGSMMHFFRSLYDNDLEANRFELRRMFRVENQEKLRVKEIYRQVGDSVRNARRSAGHKNEFEHFVIDSLLPFPDSVRYYEDVLRQKDYVQYYRNDLLTADSVLTATDNDYKLFYFDDYLYVTYTGASEEQAYLQHSFEQRNPSSQRSFVFLLQKEALAVYRNGSYYPPHQLHTMDYWAWKENAAGILPMDYIPGGSAR